MGRVVIFECENLNRFDRFVMDGWWWDGELLEAFRIVPAGMF